MSIYPLIGEMAQGHECCADHPRERVSLSSVGSLQQVCGHSLARRRASVAALCLHSARLRVTAALRHRALACQLRLYWAANGKWDLCGGRTRPHGSLFALLTHTDTPVNAAVGRLVSAAAPGCPCLGLGCQALLKSVRGAAPSSDRALHQTPGYQSWLAAVQWGPQAPGQDGARTPRQRPELAPHSDRGA